MSTQTITYRPWARRPGQLRKDIVFAVACGHNSFRSIAGFLRVPWKTVHNYFDQKRCPKPFTNGDLLTWQPGKSRTLRLGPAAAVLRDADGNVVDVGRIDTDFQENRQLLPCGHPAESVAGDVTRYCTECEKDAG